MFEIISAYSRSEAIQDGVLVDLSALAPEVCRQHFKVPIACTQAVWDIIDRAVRNPRWMNDLVSTERQHAQNQYPELVKLARERGYEIAEVYEEQVSALKERPEWKRCWTACLEGRYSALLVWSIDRLGRTMVGNLDTILTLDKIGVEVVSAREPWLQMKSPVRDLLIGIFSWLAAQERARISERTIASLDRLRVAGTKLGRPVAQVDIAKAMELVERMSLRAAAEKLGVGRSTLARLVSAQRRIAAAQTVSKTFTRSTAVPEVAQPLEDTIAA